MKTLIGLAGFALASALVLGGLAAEPDRGTVPRPTHPSQRAAPKARRPAPSTHPTMPRARNYDFEGDVIDGDRNRPDGTTIFGMKEARHPSLVKPRAHFLSEIVRTAERL